MFELIGSKIYRGRRRAIALMTSVALGFNFLPFLGNVEEVQAVPITGNVGTVTITAVGNNTYNSTITIDNAGSPSLGNITLDPGETTLSLSETNSPSTSISAITVSFDNNATWNSGGGDDITGTLSWGFTDDADAPVGANVPFIITVNETPIPPTPDPGWVNNVTVNGSNLSFAWNGNDMTYTVSPKLVLTTTGEMKIGVGAGYSLVVQYGNGITLTSNTSTEYIFTYSIQGEGNADIEILDGTNTMVGTFHITLGYVPPTPGGNPTGNSGGGATKEETIEIINEKNEGNFSSDTILIPNGTTENGGVSNTNVSSKEIEALISLVEQHKGDIPEGDREAIIEIKDKGENPNGEYSVSITEGDSNRLAASIADSLTIRTSIGDFRLKSDEMNALIEKNKGTMKFQMIKISHEDRPGVDARLTIGNVLITQMETGYGIEIRIPYTPKEGEDTSSLLIEYIDEEGNTHVITESRYDSEAGCLVFFATHLSKYGVSYKPVLFSDVSGKHWASANIIYLASRGVISGSGDGRFRPDDKVTTAEFITMMTRAFSAASLGKKTVKSYRDVPLEAWYAKAVGWSYMNNISNVIAKNGMIHPNQPLNRQNMATLSNNISLSLSLKLRNNKPVINFKDNGQIVSYAKQGVERMVKCGILAGNTSGNLMPNSNLTRAEASKVIGTLMSGMR